MPIMQLRLIESLAAMLERPNEWVTKFGTMGLAKPKVPVGFVLTRTVEVDANGKEIRHGYVHPYRAEKGGGVFVPYREDTNQVGLIARWRFQTPDMKAYSATYPEVDVSKLGRTSYEFPRGYAKLSESGAKTASREAEEETGSAVVETQHMGQICDNSTQSIHLIDIVVGTVDMEKRSKNAGADPNEGILQVEWFDKTGIKNLIEKGLLYDGVTLSAMALCLAKINFKWR